MPLSRATAANNAPEKSVLGEFLATAGEQQGAILGLVGIAASVIVWFLAPDLNIKIAWLWVASTVFLVIIWLLIATCKRLNEKPAQYLPRALTALENNGISKNPIIILERSDFFGHGSLVTVFYVNDHDIELQVGSGQVATIQMDGKIQVEIDRWSENHRDKLEALMSRSKDALLRTLVKPTTTSLFANSPFAEIPNFAPDEQLGDDT